MIEPTDSTSTVDLLCDGTCRERLPVAAALLPSSCDAARWCALLLLFLLLDFNKFDWRCEQSAGERDINFFHSVFGCMSGGFDVHGGETATCAGEEDLA